MATTIVRRSYFVASLPAEEEAISATEPGQPNELGWKEERDPVCGMTLDPADAAAVRHIGGSSIYFCSAQCAHKFDSQPEEYLRRMGVDPKDTTPIHAPFGAHSSTSIHNGANGADTRASIRADTGAGT